MKRVLDIATKKKQAQMVRRGRVGLKNRKQKRIPESTN